MIKLYNTLTKTKEVFTPLDPSHIGMYVCGPTVYDQAHIGNARAMVIFDMLYRILSHQYGYKSVTYVRNITDVDDKINARAKENGIPIDTLTTQTTNLFHEDMAYLGCYALHEDATDLHRLEPRATHHISDMIAMCEVLIARNHAYTASNHVLFDIKSFPPYGHLSRRTPEEMIAGARIDIAPYKKNPADFVLWKPSQPEEPGWESPWGRGRPGWHIECSAMSTRYLGATFDIHGGGADLQFPHHENEIAQSCAAYPDSQFARYWVHNGFLTVNGEKMSKSLGNFITVRELMNKGLHGEIIRYVLLATHYRKPLDWTDKAVHDAAKALESFYRAYEKEPAVPPESPHPYTEPFFTALYDDMNTPKAMVYLHTLVSHIHKASGTERSQYAQALVQCAQFIGLLRTPPADWFGYHQETDPMIRDYVHARNEARKQKNWKEADRIRNLLQEKGIAIEDHPDGTTTWRILSNP